MARDHSTSRSLLLTWLLALAFLTCGGCTPPATGTFTPVGFKSANYGYQVAALQSGRLLPPPWQLDNYYLTAHKTLEPKNADSYVSTFELDLEGDGNYETKAKQFTYDLRFKNLVHDGVIFLRTFPISTDLRQKKLDVLMDRYIEQIAGAGYELVSLSPTSSIVVEKRYAAAVIDRTFAKLGGQEAYVATVEVANLDQVKVDPNARKARVQLVLLHTNFLYMAKNEIRKTTRAFPVVMFAGYANQPRDFAAGLPDFHDLLARIAINNHTGFSLLQPANAGASVPPTTPNGSATESGAVTRSEKATQ